MRLWDGAASQSPSPWGWWRGWRVRLGARPAERASGPWSDLPGGQPRAASPRPPRLPRLHSKRMNQRRLGARPPRFLFSFSTPRAAGATRLHRRSFPGTLPLAPLSALGVPGPSSILYYKKIPNCQRLPGRPRLVLPRSLCPGRPAASPLLHPEQPRAARSEAQPDRRWRERVWLQGCGWSEGGERQKTRRGAPAARGRAGPGLRRDLARTRARPRTCPVETPNAPRSCCASRVTPVARASSYPPPTQWATQTRFI